MQRLAGRVTGGALLAVVFTLLLGTGPGCAVPTHDESPDESIIAIGDSVMLGAKRCLEKAGIAVDAKGSRSPRAGLSTMRTLGSHLPAHLIVHLGTNGGIDRRLADEVMTLAGPGRTVTWITIQLPDDTPRYTFEARSNQVIRDVVAFYPNTRLADWNELSDRVGGLVWPEGIHLTPDGCQAYAQIVQSAVLGSEPVRMVIRRPKPGLAALLS